MAKAHRNKERISYDQEFEHPVYYVELPDRNIKCVQTKTEYAYTKHYKTNKGVINEEFCHWLPTLREENGKLEQSICRKLHSIINFFSN